MSQNKLYNSQSQKINIPRVTEYKNNKSITKQNIFAIEK